MGKQPRSFAKTTDLGADSGLNRTTVVPWGGLGSGGLHSTHLIEAVQPGS